MGQSRRWTLLAALLVVPAAVQLDAQTMSAGMNMAPIPHAPVHVTLDSTTHHVVITTGPWKLPPMMMDGDDADDEHGRHGRRS